MPIWRYDNVRAMVAVPDAGLRRSVRQALFSRGLQGQTEAVDIEDVQSGLRGGEVDLLVTSSELPHGDVGTLLQQMRHSRVGVNPFIIVMTLVNDPNQDKVRRVFETGTDDVLLMPLQPAQLSSRLDNFVAGRKKFIVTHDYVGPDRRIALRPGFLPPPQLEVPNPIRWQVVANSDRGSLETMIRDTNARINMHKMRGYCTQMTYLVQRMITSYFNDDDIAQVRSDAANMGILAEDLVRRMDGTAYAVGRELAASLLALSDRLARTDRQPRPVELEILPTLERAIHKVFEEEIQMVA